jgi:hypothetical protein
LRRQIPPREAGVTRRLRLVVLGTMAANPYAGMAWMHMQITAGLRRLGHDAWYIEASSDWPYDPVRQMKVGDAEYAVPYLARVAESFGLADYWAYRRSYSDRTWLGPGAALADDLLAHADAVFNVAGATRIAEDGLRVGHPVYFGTDPVLHEVGYANGDAIARAIIDEHAACVTYGENIGRPGASCPVPPLPRLRGWTRQPVLLDLWGPSGPPARDAFTTVGNWKQVGLDVTLGGETYRWSKHHEFLKFIDAPRRVRRPLEVAMNLGGRRTVQAGGNEAVPALGVGGDDFAMLESHGWRLADGPAFSTDPWRYRDYVRRSAGEFTVARDLNVRTRSGWFSERSACYLAAGRPVVTQDTGFGTVLPTGAGLFAFNTMDDVLAAFEAIDADYERHSRAARAIAEEYFRAETVLARVLYDLGL